MANKLKTRVTEILGVEYPLIMGTMQGLSSAEFVAAAVNAGAFASLASTMSNTSQELREEIRKTKSLTDKPFGVNLMAMNPNSPRYIDLIADFGIRAVQDLDSIKNIDCVIVTVTHNAFKDIGLDGFLRTMKKDPILIDVRSMFSKEEARRKGVYYFTL